MTTIKTIAALALTTGFASADIDRRELHLHECPASVQATIEANARGGMIEEVDLIAIEGKEIYIAEVELPRDLDLKIYVSGNGSLVGRLNGRLLSANVSGQFVTSTGGGCLFTGTLQAQAQTSFVFRVGAGSDSLPGFGFGTTPPDPVFPVKPSGAGAELQVFFDSGFPDPKTVLFTGRSYLKLYPKPANGGGS